jgi:hypothetical protein
MVAVAVPEAAQASPVLRVAKDGSARIVKDRFLPSRRTTALPGVRSGTRIVKERSRARARASQAPSPTARQRYNAALAEARRVRDTLTGAQRAELAGAIATAEGSTLAASSPARASTRS